GFATFAGSDEVHESIVWAKFAALAEGARIASKELWAKRAAKPAKAKAAKAPKAAKAAPKAAKAKATGKARGRKTKRRATAAMRPSRSITLALAILLAAAWRAPTHAQGGDAAGAPIELTILAINDFHGHLKPPPGGIAIADPADRSRKIKVSAGGAEHMATL